VLLGNKLGRVALRACIAVSLAWLAWSSFSIYIVRSASMLPTLTSGQIILARNYTGMLDARKIERGDIVVFRSAEGRTNIKRVLAVEGDHVAGRGTVLYLNGSPLREQYTLDFVISGLMTEYSFEDTKVSAGKVFVLGDNRSISVDSREYGTISLGAVRGIVIVTLPSIRQLARE
jgi:signal peptidase I